MKHRSTRRISMAVIYTMLCLLPLMLATPARALGYTDPGMGTFVYQAAYAAFLGGTFYLRRFLNRIFKKRGR